MARDCLFNANIYLYLLDYYRLYPGYSDIITIIDSRRALENGAELTCSTCAKHLVFVIHELRADLYPCCVDFLISYEIRSAGYMILLFRRKNRRITFGVTTSISQGNNVQRGKLFSRGARERCDQCVVILAVFCKTTGWFTLHV